MIFLHAWMSHAHVSSLLHALLLALLQIRAGCTAQVSIVQDQLFTILAGKTPGPTRTPTPFELQQKRHLSTGEPCRAIIPAVTSRPQKQGNLLLATQACSSKSWAFCLIPRMCTSLLCPLFMGSNILHTGLLSGWRLPLDRGVG